MDFLFRTLARCASQAGLPGRIDAESGLLTERAALMRFARRGGVSPGGRSRILNTADGFAAATLSRPEDIDLLPAWIGSDDGGDPRESLKRAARDVAAQALVDQGQLPSVPVARLNDPYADATMPVRLYSMAIGQSASSDGHIPLVLDFSSLWAGPLCGHFLTQLGVIKIESLTRPDSARRGNATFFDLLHCGQEMLAVDFASADQVETGTVRGDRIEHGGIIDPAAAPALASCGLTVVTQPSFVAERGDQYLDEVDKDDIENLYPCAGLLRRGIPVAASTDAPYSRPDPWKAIAAASTRRTRSGRMLGEQEAVSPRKALGLFLGAAGDPGGRERRIEPGATADFCLLGLPLADALHAPSKECAAATVVDGNVVFVR